MLLGEPPFSGPSPQAVMARHSVVGSGQYINEEQPGVVLEALARLDEASR
jgi:hypothetical protein